MGEDKQSLALSLNDFARQDAGNAYKRLYTHTRMVSTAINERELGIKNVQIASIYLLVRHTRNPDPKTTQAAQGSRGPGP